MGKTCARHKTTETVLNTGWRLAAISGWRLVVFGGWWLVVLGGRPSQRKGGEFLKTALESTGTQPGFPSASNGPPYAVESDIKYRYSHSQPQRGSPPSVVAAAYAPWGTCAGGACGLADVWGRVFGRGCGFGGVACGGY